MKKIITPLGNVETTERGFAFINFTDRYGVACSLQKSSLADYEPPGTSAVWLGVDDPAPKILAADAATLGVKTEERTGWIPYPIPKEVFLTTRMHLDLKQAKALVAVLEMWIASGEFAGMSDKVTGVLAVGTNGNGEVVINHPDLKPDADGVGHIVFSPNQARNLARLLNDHANKAENIACPFDVGDKVILTRGRKEYLDYLGVGTIARITASRVVVQWANGGRARNHIAATLRRAD